MSFMDDVQVSLPADYPRYYCLKHNLRHTYPECPDCSHPVPLPPIPPVPPTTKKGTGTKHDQGKPRVDLLDRVWLEEVAKVLGFGAQKYAANNWRSGLAQSRLIAAGMRHLLAHNSGEDLDPESGLPHLAHASCCLMFATHFMKTRPDLDDRFKGVPA